MPNYMNRPVSSGFRNTYREQFVPLPLEIFARANESAQRTQNQYIEAEDRASDELYKLRGLGEHDTKKLEDYRSTFENSAKELANTDLTKLENQESAKRLIKNISRDKDLQTINYNYGQYQEYLKKRDQLVDDNNYQEYNDTFLPQYQDYIKSGGYKSGKKLDPNVFKYMDTRPIKEEFFNNMGEDGSDAIKQAGETYYKEGWKGISSGRVNSRAKQAFDSYLGTNAAQQELREFNYMKKSNPKSIKGMDAQEFVWKRFLDAGLERVHGVSDSNRDTALNAEHKRKKEEENLFKNTVLPETPGTLSNGMKLEFKEDGQLFGSGRPWSEIYEKEGAWGLLKKVALNQNHDLSDEETKNAAHVLMGAKLNGVTPKQYAERYNTTSHMMVPRPLIGKALADNSKMLRDAGAGLISDLNLMNVTSGEKGLNFKDALAKAAEEKGLEVPDRNKDPKKFDEFLDKVGVKVTGSVEPNEFTSRGVAFTLGDNNFVADMTYGGTNMKGVSKEDVTKSNFDKLMKGQLVEGNHDGKKGAFFRNLKKLDKSGNPVIDFKSEEELNKMK